MKKILVFVMLCLFAVQANAALIRNRTGCSIVVNMICYSKATCGAPSMCTASITVPPGGTATLPTCGCVAPSLQGYVVCWDAPCANVCVGVSDAAGGPCPNLPIANVLPACPGCNSANANIFYNMMGDLVIQ